MISVVIGGGTEEQSRFSSLYVELGRPNVISTLDEDAFVDFCKRSLRSTNKLKIMTGEAEKYIEEVANDDMIVFFTTQYIQSSKIPILYKLATVIEVAIDLGLDVQAFSFAEQLSWNPQKLEWPAHWPSVYYYATREER